MDKLKKILKSELGLLLVLALLCVVFAVASPHFLKQQNLTFSADILNVLDSKTAVDTTNTGVATYASGRTFWLDVSMKF